MEISTSEKHGVEKNHFTGWYFWNFSIYSVGLSSKTSCSNEAAGGDKRRDRELGCTEVNLFESANAECDTCCKHR